MTTVTISDTTHSVTVQEAVYQVQIASGASDTQIISSGGAGNSLISDTAGVVTTLKTISAGSNITLNDDGDTITVSSTDTEDDLSNNTTDDLAEGSNNQYFTDARVMTALETVSGHVVPSANVTYDLGSTTHMWRDVYVGPGSLYVNGQKVISSQTGRIDITTDPNETLNIQSGGSLSMLSANEVTSLTDATINLGPTVNNGTINVRGTLDVVNKIEMGDLDLTSGLIHQDSGNDLVLRTNSGHNIVADTDVLLVGATDGANTQITPTGVTGTVSSIANHDTDALSEGSNNLYHTTARVQSVIDTNTAGYITDYTVTQADVTQHQSALSITQSQISDLDHYNSTDFSTDFATKSTTDLSEGTNLYYTDARADARAQLKIDALVDSAPGTLDTLNELAAALGDDANFSTTVTNNIATKLAISDFDSTFDTRLATKDTDNISEGSSNLYYTDARFDTRLGTKDTDNLSEGSSNQYFTTARARASISASGSLSYNSSTGALTYTQGNTDTVAEGSSNLYYTDARFNTAFSGKSTSDLSEGTNLYYTDARFDTRLGTKDTDDVSEGSTNLYYTDARFDTRLATKDTGDLSEGSNQYFTNARAISAVEGESTLDLTGQVTMSQDLDVSGLIKINDGFTLGSFNPYGAGNDMPTTMMGAGQESGWAALTVRSRGEHDFGIGSQYNLAPRGLVNIQTGRLDGSNNDDYLNNNDSFGAVLWSPYSGYRTGTEWLTPAASIYAIATEDHSANGMGTRFEFSTTENTNKAGAADLAHTNKSVYLQGTTFSSSDTIKIDDDLQVTGNIGNSGSAVDFEDSVKITGNVSTKTTTIGDFDTSGSPAYAQMGIQIDAGDTAWPSVVFKEYAGTDGGGNKPVNLFTNPGFETEVFGGTPSSPAALGDAKRILAVNGNAANGATLPGLANIRILGQTVGVQSGTNRGSEFILQTTPADETTIRQTLKLTDGNIVVIGESGYDSGHAIIRANGGDVKIDDNLQANNDLTVDGTATFNGNVTLGNASDDTITATGKLNTSNGFRFTVMDTATANYISGVLGIASAGDAAYVSDGDSGNPCLAIYSGSAWKRIALGSDISSS